MKKSILLLALISLTAFIVPQVNASDRDVGYSFSLPVDNAAVVADQAVMNLSSEYVLSVELRDPGDMPMELSAQSTGLEAKSPVIITALSNGDLTDIQRNMRDQHGTRLNDLINRCQPDKKVMSTSNGGAGY